MTGKKEIAAKRAWGPSWTLGLVGGAVALHLFLMGGLFWGYLDGLSDITNVQPRAVDFFSIYRATGPSPENGSTTAASATRR